MQLWLKCKRRRLHRHFIDLRRPFASVHRHYLLTLLFGVHRSCLPPTCDMSPSNCSLLEAIPGPHLYLKWATTPSLIRKHAGVPSSVGAGTLGVSARCWFSLTGRCSNHSWTCQHLIFRPLYGSPEEVSGSQSGLAAVAWSHLFEP